MQRTIRRISSWGLDKAPSFGPYPLGKTRAVATASDVAMLRMDGRAPVIGRRQELYVASDNARVCVLHKHFAST